MLEKVKKEIEKETEKLEEGEEKRTRDNESFKCLEGEGNLEKESGREKAIKFFSSYVNLNRRTATDFSDSKKTKRKQIQVSF